MPHIAELIKMIELDDPKKIRIAARTIAKHYSQNFALLEVVNKELLNGYHKKTKGKYYIDAMSWLCKVIGASGNKKYIPTLEKVGKEAPSRKLKKYARKNLKRLK